ncbi:hypothetical protein LTR37_011338 [Vermiconidia calcicola]|uniref:Uncharacterized protein n=1 Tax=Vermiconidia calcicola TaxID=1690605 RepID=A0ACC3N2R7_9PEZI|nr:hypothetical protein LTR37_011338 [Vermiconidia calcicola]
MATESSDSTNALAQGMQSLPAELYDKIYKEVFSYGKRSKFILNKSYKPPARLHVDRKSRNEFAQAYYGGTLFISNAETVPLWLSSLPETHLDMLSEVQCVSKSLLDEKTRAIHDQLNMITGKSRKNGAYGAGKHFMRGVESDMRQRGVEPSWDMREGVIRWVIHYLNDAGDEAVVFFGGSPVLLLIVDLYNIADKQQSPKRTTDGNEA